MSKEDVIHTLKLHLKRDGVKKMKNVEYPVYSGSNETPTTVNSTINRDKIARMRRDGAVFVVDPVLTLKFVEGKDPERAKLKQVYAHELVLRLVSQPIREVVLAPQRVKGVSFANSSYPRNLRRKFEDKVTAVRSRNIDNDDIKISTSLDVVGEGIDEVRNVVDAEKEFLAEESLVDLDFGDV
jgi:hypothetical protein